VEDKKHSIQSWGTTYDANAPDTMPVVKISIYIRGRGLLRQIYTWWLDTRFDEQEPASSFANGPLKERHNPAFGGLCGDCSEGVAPMTMGHCVFSRLVMVKEDDAD
jgi:hypothetical protein